MGYLLRPLLRRVLLVKQLSLDPERVNSPGPVRVAEPHEAHAVLYLRFLVRGGGEHNEVEPAEAVAFEDAFRLVLLQTGVGEELDSLEPVDGILVESLWGGLESGAQGPKIYVQES